MAEACVALLGGGTISGIRREWIKLGLKPSQQAQRGTTEWNRTSIRMILLNPRIAGLSACHGEIVGQGDWEPLVPEETWRAGRGILDDPTRKPPRGVRTLLGGLGLCRSYHGLGLAYRRLFARLSRALRVVGCMAVSI